MTKFAVVEHTQSNNPPSVVSALTDTPLEAQLLRKDLEDTNREYGRRDTYKIAAVIEEHDTFTLGWFSDVSEDAPTDSHRWQPCLQLDGMCLSFDIWHDTKEACDEFIRTEIVGRPWLPDSLR
jgi:hypothetical protein